MVDFPFIIHSLTLTFNRCSCASFYDTFAIKFKYFLHFFLNWKFLAQILNKTSTTIFNLKLKILSHKRNILLNCDKHYAHLINKKKKKKKKEWKFLQRYMWIEAFIDRAETYWYVSHLLSVNCLRNHRIGISSFLFIWSS